MLQERLTQVIEPAVESVGYELVLLEFGGAGRTATLRLYIDHPDGISLDDCERVSREVAAVLDVEDPIPQAYRLEVSSPGLDRPLAKPAHFERFRGEQVRLLLAVPLDGRRKLQGVLLGFENGAVMLQTDSGELTVPWADIEKARLVPSLEIRESEPEHE